MTDETMQPPPCADHGYNRLECPECGDACRIHYEKVAASLSAVELKCPCGDFAPGDPSYEHSIRHTPWLRAAEHRSLLELDRALRPDGESTSARLRRVEQEHPGGYIPGPVQTFEREPGEEIISAAEVRGYGRELLDRLNTESTSARLRRVEQERDELADEVRVLKNSEGLAVVAAEARANLAEAELASARTELNGLRAANDQLRADYSAAADELEQLRGNLGVKRVGELEEQLALTDPQGAVISRQRRYLCETCGSRYGINYTDHAHGPLTPVVVTSPAKETRHEQHL